jgi:hypothetical protein
MPLAKGRRLALLLRISCVERNSLRGAGGVMRLDRLLMLRCIRVDASGDDEECE